MMETNVFLIQTFHTFAQNVCGNRVLVYNIPANLNLVFYKLGVEYSVVNRSLACSAATHRAAWRSFLRR
jgi:hypothetical protein